MTPELLDMAQDTPPDFAPGTTDVPESMNWAGPDRAELAERLQQLAALEENWDSYGARPLDPAALRTAQEIIEQALTWPAPAPRIFPVPDGGIQLEWRAGPVELELEIEPTGSAVFVCDDAAADQEIDGELPADEPRFSLAVQRLIAYR
jgi:hypothetical protein